MTPSVQSLGIAAEVFHNHKYGGLFCESLAAEIIEKHFSPMRQANEEMEKLLKRARNFIEAEHIENYTSPCPPPEPTDRDIAVGYLIGDIDRILSNCTSP